MAKMYMIKQVWDDDGSKHWEYQEVKHPPKEVKSFSERINDSENAMMDIGELTDSTASAQEGING